MSSSILTVGLFMSFALFCLALGQKELSIDTAQLANESLVMKSPSETSTYKFKNCILLRMRAYFRTVGGEIIDLKNGLVNEGRGYCGELTNVAGIKIQFKNGFIYFDIVLGEEHNSVVRLVAGGYTLSDSDFYFISEQNLYFKTTLPGHHYECNSEQSIPMREGGQLFLSNFAYEVSRNSTSSEFSQPAEFCTQDKTANSYFSLFTIMLFVFITLLVILVLKLTRKPKLTYPTAIRFP